MLRKGLLNTNGTVGFIFNIFFPFFFFFFFFLIVLAGLERLMLHQKAKLQLAKDGGTKLPVPLVLLITQAALHFQNFVNFWY